MNDLLNYKLGNGVEAYTLGKGSQILDGVIQPHQIHSDHILIISNRNIRREDLYGIDALITNLIDCPIAVRTADCVPILLYDPENNAIAAVHSGWRGTVLKIAQKVIIKMKEVYCTRPERIKAVIGPSIGPESFFVHEDVREAFQSAKFPMDEICRQYNKNLFIIDLWKSNKWLLQQVGLNDENIQVAGICTFMNHEVFYSARYEKNNKCGRNINVIRIKDKCEVLTHQKVD